MADTPSFEVGDSVCVRHNVCTVRFIGPTTFSDGTWVGVEFNTACGRNDGSVEGERYFDCPRMHGLFVRPAHVQPVGAASSRVARDAPVAHVNAWTVMEEVLEGEALAASVEGQRVLRHLENLHPSDGGGGGGTAARTAPSKGLGSPGRVARGGPRRGGAGADMAARLRTRFSAALPKAYGGPTFAEGWTPASMSQLLAHIKKAVASGAKGPAVPAKLAVEILLGAKEQLEATGRSVLVPRS